MPYSPDSSAHLTPEQRRREIAAILARGVLRLRRPPDKPAPSPATTTKTAKVDLGDRAGALMPGTVLTRPSRRTRI